VSEAAPRERRFFSPTGFVVTAVVLAVLYGAAHAAGLREDASFLSGTMPPGGAAGMALGFVYVALHFAFVLGAPALVLGAGILWLFERRSAR
jgi:hypothetical protein